MLRQPRPNSQPPLRFERLEHQRPQAADKEPGWTPTGRNQSRLAAEPSGLPQIKSSKSELAISSASSSSSSSSSSNASSLASSTVSISTSSSTSTVLAARAGQPASSKSMIARYASSKQELARPTSSEEEEDEGAGQLCSPNSSASSSSGLSSMNSSQASQPADAGSLESKVGECLRELVGRVADQLDATANQYASFGLHEAVLAQTSSQTSASSDDGSSPTEAPLGPSGGAGQRRFSLRLVRSVELAAELDDAELVQVASECLLQSGSPQRADRRLCSLEAGAISWRPADDELGPSESVALRHVARCLVHRDLLLWVLCRAEQQAPSVLETTLDDIALALDEPISAGRATGVGRARALELLVWLCQSGDDARQLGEQFSMMSNNGGELGKPQSSSDNKQTLAGHDFREKQQPEAPVAGCRIMAAAKESARAKALNQQPSKTRETPVGAECGQVGGRGQKAAQVRLAEERGQKKSASGLDLSANSSLASYYRGVASRMISNGQSKIRSIKDEMIKLNHRRSSVALSSSLARSACDLSVATTSPRPAEQQRAAPESRQVNAKSTPAIKPRTSILRNKQQVAAEPADQVKPRSILKSSRPSQAAPTDRRQQADAKGAELACKSRLATERHRPAGQLQVRAAEPDRRPAREPQVASDQEEPADAGREQAFERLRQRASCYDITRLMSRNGLQGQLGKLRAGDTSSVAAKTRQRRPPLLLEREQRPKTASSGADGTVRVQVGGGQSHPTADAARKQSEFDPRSLRRPLAHEPPAEDAAVETNDEEEEEEEEEGGEQRARLSRSLSKGGPFSLLRQSFNQKTLSSMLKFSGRASLRLRASEPAEQVAEQAVGSDGAKSSAIAIAEANLLAAKQLKQQAQRLREQQRREQQQQQQQQQPTIEAAMMLAAVQYNQQVQRQQVHQQQLLYQQQYAAAARGHLLDATSLHMQHQMMRQQQQQQFGLMANLNSAHFMHQQVHGQLVHPAQALLPMGPMGYLAAPGPAPPMPLGQQQRMGPREAAAKQLYPAAGHQLIPMAVNHHSSFNIVYAQQPAAASYAAEPAPAASSKSKLGASMRKTVKSILINKSAFLQSSSGGPAAAGAEQQVPKQQQQQQPVQAEFKLKSALKAAPKRDLNSEGSDGDGSSSDSTITAGQVGATSVQVSAMPKSALKKTSSSSSSDSSCSPPPGELDEQRRFQQQQQQVKDKQQPLTSSLTRGFDCRQSIKLNHRPDQTPFASNSANRMSRRKSMGTVAVRKNVTFSSKLTSIL